MGKSRFTTPDLAAAVAAMRSGTPGSTAASADDAKAAAAATAAAAAAPSPSSAAPAEAAAEAVAAAEAAAAASTPTGVVGYRVVNIYDSASSGRMTALKLARPGHPKALLLIESGLRMHLTGFELDHPPVPSIFTLKLRKHLRGRRLDSVTMVGADRVAVLAFYGSTGNAATAAAAAKRTGDKSELGTPDKPVGGSADTVYLILEFYAGGNIILCDSTFTILQCKRTHRYADGSLVGVNQRYPFDSSVKIELAEPTCASLTAALDQAVAKLDGATDREAAERRLNKELVRSFLGRVTEISAPLAEHCAIEADIAPKLTVADLRAMDDDARNALWRKVLPYLCEAVAWISSASRDMGEGEDAPAREAHPDGIERATTVPFGKRGYIILKRKPQQQQQQQQQQKQGKKKADAGAAGAAGAAADDENDENAWVYDEFSPALLAQHRDRKYVEFDSFDAAVDKFFISVTEQRLQAAAEAAKLQVTSKVDRMRAELERRKEQLEAAIGEKRDKAALIELHAELADAVTAAVRDLIGRQLPWPEIEQRIKEAQRESDPIASLIHRIDFTKRTVEMYLFREEEPEVDEDDGEEEEDADDDESEEEEEGGAAEDGDDAATPVLRPVVVLLNLDDTAGVNARRFFDAAKKAASKRDATLAASATALQKAEARADKQLAQQHTRTTVKTVRKPLWWEKFFWFVSTDGVLVIGGRDAQQNEMLVRRYLRAGDLYVHADLHGAPSLIVKNSINPKDPQKFAASIPQTLVEAGDFAVCRSRAWMERVVTSAYWVYANQVSKTAPSGEYLTTGSFMIRGRKNVLPAANLIMGFGVVFKLHESAVAERAAQREERERDILARSSSGLAVGAAAGAAAAAEDGDAGASAAPDGDDVTAALLGEDGQSMADLGFGVGGGDEAGAEGLLAGADDDSLGMGLLAGAEDAAAAADEGGVGGDEGAEKTPASAAEAAAAAAAEVSDGEGKEEEVVLPDVQDDPEWLAQMPQGPAERRRERGLSAREKRLLKKGKTMDEIMAMRAEREQAEAAAEAAEHAGGAASSSEEEDDGPGRKGKGKGKGGRGGQPKAGGGRRGAGAKAAAKKGAPKKGPGPKPLTRAQRSKRKKAAKYADQDDEDRAAAMALLHGGNKAALALLEKESQVGQAGKRQKASSSEEDEEDAAERAAAAAAAAEKAKQVEDEVLSHLTRCYICNQSSHTAKDCPERGTRRSAMGDVRRRDRAEVRALAKEDADFAEAILTQTELSDAELKGINELDAFTGTPGETDKLLFAVPVCAPYSALRSYKYKVKLTPLGGGVGGGGSGGKKGRVVKTAINVFVRQGDVTEQEDSLIRAMNENETGQQMIASAKIGVVGLQKVQGAMKAERRQAAKAKAKKAAAKPKGGGGGGGR